MTVVFVILAILCALIGIIGAIVPGVPGPPISWLALLFLNFTRYNENFSFAFLLITALIAVVITILDFFIPVWGTKRFGGTKAGTRGSTIGLLVSVFLLPLLGITIGPFGIIGILLGPFVGAYVGERIHQTSQQQAWCSAFGSFIGFLAGTLIKLTYGIVIIVYVVKAFFN